MRVTDIESPGMLVNSYKLRKELASAVSQCELQTNRVKTNTSKAKELRKSLSSTVKALDAMIPKEIKEEAKDKADADKKKAKAAKKTAKKSKKK